MLKCCIIFNFPAQLNTKSILFVCYQVFIRFSNSICVLYKNKITSSSPTLYFYAVTTITYSRQNFLWITVEFPINFNSSRGFHPGILFIEQFTNNHKIIKKKKTNNEKKNTTWKCCPSLFCSTLWLLWKGHWFLLIIDWRTKIFNI